MSILIKYPPALLRQHISTIPDINVLPSPTILFSMLAVLCWNKLETTFFSHSERAFDTILVLIFTKDMGRQSFFSLFLNLIISSLCEMLYSPLFFASVTEVINNSLILSSKLFNLIVVKRYSCNSALKLSTPFTFLEDWLLKSVSLKPLILF